MSNRPAFLRARTGSVLAAAGLACAVAALSTLDLRTSRGTVAVAQARAEDDWFTEFEAVCSRTQDAMTISSDELRALLSRCEKLKPRVETLDPSRRKVYQKRLQLCRDLYQFVLDTREQR